ncbi:reverse transcriptase domain-containing protein [Tanacetum coccineum]
MEKTKSNQSQNQSKSENQPRECLKIIESKSKVRNSRSKPVVAKVSASTSTSGISPDVSELKDMVKALLLDKKNQSQAPAHQTPTSVKAVEESCVNQPPTYQAPVYQAPAPQTQGVSKTDFDSYVKANDAVMRNVQNQGQNLQAQLNNLGTSNQRLESMLSNFNKMNTASTSGLRTLPVMNHDTEVTKDTMLPTNNGSTEDVQPPVIQVQSQNLTSEPDVDPASVPKPNQETSIMFPSRRNDERRHEKANNQIEKFFEIFRDLSFKISFTDALTLMSKFASTLKTLLGNKMKLSEMARTPLNENCSAVILNKLPKKLGDPGRFLIPCEFSRINICNALADLGASINLIPYSVWKDLSLPELTLTCMTLELADRSITETNRYRLQSGPNFEIHG